MSNVVPLRGRRPAIPQISHDVAAAPIAPEPLWRERIGVELRRERQRRQERIADVADRAGIAAQYLSEIERGRKDASSEVLEAVAGSLELTVVDLATRAVRSTAAAAGRGGDGRPLCLAA